MAVPVVVQASTVASGTAVAFIEVTMPAPVTAGNAVVLVMVGTSNISGRTFTVTDNVGWGGWALALQHTPNCGGTVHHRFTCPAGTPTIRITVSSSTFTGSLIALEVSGIAATGILTTGTHTEASSRTAHTCSSVALTATDVFVVCFSGLTATAGSFVGYGSGYTGAVGNTTRCIQYKVTASLNDAGPWTTGGTARIGNAGMVVFPNAGFTPTMTRVQGTGKARLANSTAPLTWSFSTLPAVGNGLVVLVWGSDATAAPLVFANGWVTDNQGNEYVLAQARQTPSAQFATAIYYCPKVQFSSGTFTLSLTSGIAGRLHWWVASAVEVGGLGVNSLVLAAAGNASGASSATATSGVTSGTGEMLLAATMTRGATSVASSIVVEAANPAWVQEAEELDGSAYMAGEADTRITLLSGTTSATWTQAPNAAYAGTIVGFRSAPVTVIQRWGWTGKIRVGPVAALVTDLSSVVNSGIIAQVLGYRSTGMTFGAMTDSAGHTYTLVASRRITTNGEYAVGIFFLPRLLSDHGGNLVLTLAGVAGDYYTANVTDYQLGGGELALDEFASNAGTSATPTTLATSVLTGEHALVTALVKFQSTASITAQVVDPPWNEEVEELDGTNWVAGEGDSRITLASGAAVGNWTLAASGNWAALLASFRRVERPAPQNYGALVAADGASAHWRLEEETGTVADDAVAAFDGTLSGGVTLQQAGAVGLAMAFDGTSGRITVPTGAYGAWGTGGFSVELWWKHSTGGLNYQHVLDTGRFNKAGLNIDFETTTDIAVVVGNGTALATLLAPFTHRDNEWHHLVVTMSRGTTDTLRLYVDGEAFWDIDMPAPGWSVNQSYPLTLGSNRDGEWYAGALDDVAFYPLTLTSAQIARHYESRAPGTPVVVSSPNQMGTII